VALWVLKNKAEDFTGSEDSLLNWFRSRFTALQRTIGYRFQFLEDHPSSDITEKIYRRKPVVDEIAKREPDRFYFDGL